jgi:hypothetical protein
MALGMQVFQKKTGIAGPLNRTVLADEVGDF